MWKHLKLVNDADSNFMTDFVNEELNDTSVPIQWKKCTCIPVYKGKLSSELPEAYRSIILNETSLKLIEGAWLHANKSKL